MTDAATQHRFTTPTVTPAARDPWAHDPDRTTRHNVRRESVAPPAPKLAEVAS